MIITRSPFRISFFGGGSDLKAFYQKSFGSVLSITINKYMYISSHNFFDKDKIRVKYSDTETVTNLSDIKHPVYREVLKKFNVRGALEISSNADIPSGTGMGSSSSFTVNLLNNLYARCGKLVSKERLAEEACEIEIGMLNEPIGKQDQYAAAFGGLNVFTFQTNGTVSIEPIHLKKEIYQKLEDNLLLFYTGDQRSASVILYEQKKNMEDEDKIKILEQMVGFVQDAKKKLYSGKLRDFGLLLHETWMLKKNLAMNISNSKVDEIYDMGINKGGALGGKLLGAGGAGFLLLYCEKENQKRLRSVLYHLHELKFKFSHDGSKIIHIGDEYDE